jgi:hypothetical protein
MSDRIKALFVGPKREAAGISEVGRLGSQARDAVAGILRQVFRDSISVSINSMT